MDRLLDERRDGFDERFTGCEMVSPASSKFMKKNTRSSRAITEPFARVELCAKNERATSAKLLAQLQDGGLGLNMCPRNICKGVPSAGALAAFQHGAHHVGERSMNVNIFDLPIVLEGEHAAATRTPTPVVLGVRDRRPYRFAESLKHGPLIWLQAFR